MNGFYRNGRIQKPLIVFNRRIQTVSMQRASTVRQMDRW